MDNWFEVVVIVFLGFIWGGCVVLVMGKLKRAIDQLSIDKS